MFRFFQTLYRPPRPTPHQHVRAHHRGHHTRKAVSVRPYQRRPPRVRTGRRWR